MVKMEGKPTESKEKSPQGRDFRSVFSRLRGLLPETLKGEGSRRIWTMVGVVLLVLVVILSIEIFLPEAQSSQVTLPLFNQLNAEEEEGGASNAIQAESLAMPSFDAYSSPLYQGIQRAAAIHTTIPTRSRVEVLTYTVQQGDSLFAIADNFGLKPETILWGNFETLQDNPHTLQPGQQLNILPVNGTFHKWREGESLYKVAEYYGVDPLEIVQYPGNKLDIYDFDLDNPSFEIGQMLIVPGGERELVDYGPPAITRNNPAIAVTYGPGHCGSIFTGAVGVGVFLWPTTERWLSGYDYNPGIHPAIDIAGSIGNQVWASDSGVVVYAGWSNYGYGNLVVVDHGTGWQTLYAHLNNIFVGCGQSVFQGDVIGALGSTGNSSGPHLHFEMIYSGAKVNPWNFLQ
jgi:murein DD-endopeptidase MepM/ murein hydrolase activator NlpD